MLNFGLFANANRPINLVEFGIVIDSNKGLFAKAESPIVSMDFHRFTPEREALSENDPTPTTVTVSPRTTFINFSFWEKA